MEGGKSGPAVSTQREAERKLSHKYMSGISWFENVTYLWLTYALLLFGKK